MGQTTGLRFTDDDLAVLDQLMRELGCTNRSEAVRQAIRWYLDFTRQNRKRLEKRG